MDMLTDERSLIAERLSCAAHSWARADALVGRDPASELTLVLDAMNELNARRLRIAELEAALRGLLSYVDGGRNLSAQPNHPAHAARTVLER